jgi:cardiolipin synthase
MVSINWAPEWTQILIVATHVVLASIATSHALLKKSDVRAALGWIALVWLSPFLGEMLYYFFGINRVTRRALRFCKLEQRRCSVTSPAEEPVVSANIAALVAISQRVMGIPLMAGNVVSALRGGDEAYPAMLAAIGNARRSIALASYIFRSDAAGHTFVEALIAARRRDVVVRVLLDGIGSGYFQSAILRQLEAGEIPVARFLHTWLPWRMPVLNMRNHKKLLIVDGTIGFTGGLNIGIENSSRFTSKKNVDDVHARVTGPVTGQLMDAFARDWSFTTSEVLDQEVWWPTPKAAGPVFARGIQSGPDEDINSLETILAAALAQARERVRIVTPYFLPDEQLQFAITQARLRGVTVDIVIPEHCNFIFMDWAMRAHLRFFRDTPVNIYVSPLPFDHTKLMTVDGEWCLLGSSNWDTRSLRLNFEFDLECYDSALATDIDALIDRKIRRSLRLDYPELMSKPRWVRLRDAAVRLLLPYL